MRRPSVLLDVDGVIADFVSLALGIVHDITGKRYKSDDIRTWEVFDSIPEHEREKDEVYRRMKSRGGCSAIPVYDGAMEGVARLRGIADVTIVTSPFSGSETWMHERERWLEKHFGIDHRDVIHADKKFRIHGDVFIDDKVAHLHAWSDYWIGMGRDKRVQPVLWDSPRSGSEVVGAGVVRVKNWGEVFELVSDIVST